MTEVRSIGDQLDNGAGLHKVPRRSIPTENPESDEQNENGAADPAWRHVPLTAAH